MCHMDGMSGFCVKCVWTFVCHAGMCMHLGMAVQGLKISASENAYLSL